MSKLNQVSLSVVAFATGSKVHARAASVEQFGYDLSLIIGAGDRGRVDATLFEIKAKAVSKDGSTRKSFAGALYCELVRAIEQAVNMQQTRPAGQRQTAAEKAEAREQGGALASAAHDAADKVMEARKAAAVANAAVNVDQTPDQTPVDGENQTPVDGENQTPDQSRGILVDADTVDSNVDALLSALLATIGAERAAMLGKLLIKAAKAEAAKAAKAEAEAATNAEAEAAPMAEAA